MFPRVTVSFSCSSLSGQYVLTPMYSFIFLKTLWFNELQTLVAIMAVFHFNCIVAERSVFHSFVDTQAELNDIWARYVSLRYG